MTDPKQLHAFADGELAPSEANDVREALRLDAAASAEVDAVLNLKDMLAKNALVHTDEEVWKGCVARLNGIDKTRRVEGFVGRYAWALCGAMFLFILSGRSAMRNVHGDTVQTRDVAGVFGAAASVSRQTVAESQDYERTLAQVDSGLDRKALEVGYPTYGSVHDLPAARFAMRDGDGDLTLVRIDGLLNFQDTAPMPANPELGAGVADGENCLVWHTGGHTVLLAGARSLDDLGEVAARLMNAR